MKRNRIHTFLPIAISFFILVFPVYLFCSYFAETNVFPTDLGFENPDQDNQFVNQQQDGSKAFTLTFFPSGFLSNVYVLKHPPHFFSQISPLNQENLILRC